MKITRRQITQIINEELQLVAEAEIKKKKNKQKVTVNGDESREDAWAGGDNLTDPNDWEKTLDMIKEQNSDVLSPEELHQVIFEELGAVLSEVTHPFPMYEKEGGSKFTDESGEVWDVDCKSRYAMSCGDSCSARKFADFSAGDQKKLGEMCSLNESKGQHRCISRRQLRHLIKEETLNNQVQRQISLYLGGDTPTKHLVTGFFKHMGSHGAKWEGGDLEVALMNVRKKPGGGKNVRTLLQWIAWIMKDEDHTAWKNLEASLESAEGFNELNSVVADASEVANAWWPDSPGGQEEERS